MSCRSTPAGSLATTVGRLYTDRAFSDPAVLSVFHEIRRNYRPGDLNEDDLDNIYQRALARQESAINLLRSRGDITQARYDSLHARLEEARRQETPEPSLIYAVTALNRELAQRQVRFNAFVANVSARTGMTRDEVVAAYREAETNAPRVRGRHAATAEEYSDAGERIHTTIANDPATRHAVRHLTNMAEEVEMSVARQRPQRVDLEPLPPSVASSRLTVREAGYDPRVGHLVVTTNELGSHTVTQHAYRNVPQDVWDEMRTSPNPSQVWNDRVRGNKDHQYTSEREAVLASAAPRCQECGQFSRATHACPVPTPRIELTSWTGQQRWSTARLPQDALQRGIANGTVQADDSVSLPAIREFRTRVNEGAVRVRDVTAYFGPIRTEGELTRASGHVRGNLTVSRDAEGTLTVSTGALRCSCVEYQTNYDCIHLRTVADITRNRLDPPARTRARLTDAEREEAVRQAQQRAEEAAQYDWTRDEQTRAEAAATWRQETDTLYSQSPRTFREDVDSALQARAAKGGEAYIPYMTENALDGMATRQSGQGFGTEIEFDFPRSMSPSERLAARRAIATQLYEAGITRQPTQAYYGDSRRYGYVDSHTQEDGTGTWNFEYDGSVDGGELVTCVMFDEPETWRRLEQAVDIIKRNGGVASTKAGTHVHVGSSNLSRSPASYTELARIVTQHEDVYYRLASNPDRGKHRDNKYARPLQSVPPAGFNGVSEMRGWQGGKYAAVNFNNARGTGGDHVEFRIFDSSLDAGTMQAQIKMAVATVNAAERNSAAGGTARGKEPWGSHKARLQARGTRRALTDEEFEADTATTRSLIDTLFTRREDKQQIAALYAQTQWSKSRRST